eukprot:TRINITY_DN6266_c0_g1_i1.p1 TRINITY_DN6266_c0_g1~~TRINITY_DN6266_c0_g1_i1.p1  ORF type:complete len:422 (-),score=120.34 TRINITY_DN6266_c0_g1_i1:51-1286(-)
MMAASSTTTDTLAFPLHRVAALADGASVVVVAASGSTFQVARNNCGGACGWATEPAPAEAHAGNVSAVALHRDRAAQRTLLATAGDEKAVKVWDVSAEHRLCFSFNTKKRISAMAFAQSGDALTLLLADKFGEVYAARVPAAAEAASAVTPSVVLGHCSLVTCLAVSPCSGYMATGDRDEKLRVSRFPAAHMIESFCMGHTQFITNIIFCGHNLLASGAGDGTLCVWDFHTGKCLHSLFPVSAPVATAAQTDLPAATRTPIVTPTSYCLSSSLLAVLVEKNPTVHLYSLSAAGEASLRQELIVPGGAPAITATFVGLDLLVTTVADHDAKSSWVFRRENAAADFALDEAHVLPALLSGHAFRGPEKQLAELVATLVERQYMRKVFVDKHASKHKPQGNEDEPPQKKQKKAE